MPRMEPVDLLRNALKLIEGGGPVTEIATQLGITAQTEYNRQNQDQINYGVRLGRRRSIPPDCRRSADGYGN